ncbi:alpha/beta hydrolase [Rhodococcus sp. G-MC3]|uniref:alpha/beta fold hydrolase n=1 Tax=Rhodococcus sp. G-MC3 TaxID=3046209 RepID=UPI0024BB990A|nr:alpha/beta hydrolase [Rhodococcus sp. G-MC3]MDJ0392105.1 alpha/beta hydrolase [Rhodococcus sp. G-MC3]
MPGAGGDGWYWNRVAADLVSRGHDVVAVDLPAADPAAGLSEYAQAAVRQIGDRRGVVVVGQSLGGFTAPLVAERVNASLIVLLNAMTPARGESPGEWWASTGFMEARVEQARRDGRDLENEDLLVDVFLHDVPSDVVEQLMARGEPQQSDGPFSAPWPMDEWPDVPTRFLQGVDDRFFPVEFQRRLVAQRLGIDVDEMPGGHLLALSQPFELANRLEAYAAQVK